MEGTSRPFSGLPYANTAVGDVRRRMTHRLRRRGRAPDPEYTIKNLVLYGPGILSRRAAGSALAGVPDRG
jgi:hypothetical protein